MATITEKISNDTEISTIIICFLFFRDLGFTKKYLAVGYSKEQILNMKLKEVWPLIKDIKSKRDRKHFSDHTLSIM